MDNVHNYEITTEWTGNRGTGTSGYRDYGREHVISAAGKAAIDGSADRTFHGNAERWNPEELLLSALSQCHMLSYLHVATSHGVVVVSYTDAASGVMQSASDGSGHFTRATLRPRVTVAEPGMRELAALLHEEAASKCFIAASVNFPVDHEPETLVLA
jgi:organic hydroperoxide reductase OsmC/OhrA